MSKVSSDMKITRFDAEGSREQEDAVIREHALTIMIDGLEIATLMCIPDQLENLAAGFLFAEGLISTREEIKGINIRMDDTYADVELNRAFELPEHFFEDRVLGSGCGQGTFSKKELVPCNPLASEAELTYSMILDWMRTFHERSELFRLTGGAHAAALAGPEGLICFAEDIGRHNAVDKVVGATTMQGLEISDKAMCTTGRLTVEMVAKSVKRGIPVVISRSAPTLRAIEIAAEMNIVLIGFVRAKRMNVYTFPERVCPEQS